MIQCQRMEADTWQAMQTREGHGTDEPLAHVAFAFPLIFDQAMKCLPEIEEMGRDVGG